VPPEGSVVPCCRESKGSGWCISGADCGDLAACSFTIMKCLVSRVPEDTISEIAEWLVMEIEIEMRQRCDGAR
jgi:hypothetical protein